jgi:hypothetical protein
MQFPPSDRNGDAGALTHAHGAGNRPSVARMAVADENILLAPIHSEVYFPI